MAISLLTSLTAALGTFGGTTGAIDTSGAKLLVLSVAYYNAPDSVGDSKFNTWTPLTERTTGSGVKHRLYYVLNPTVGAGHTFNVPGMFIYAGVVVHAYGDLAGPLTYVAQNGAAAASGTSLATGSVTPTMDGALVVSGLAFGDASTPSNDAGLTSTLSPWSSGSAAGCTLGYKVQSPAAAINPTWSWGTSSENAASIAAFHPTAAAPSPVRLTQAPLEVAGASPPSPIRLTQAPLETVQQFAAPLVEGRLTQAPLEIIYPFGCYETPTVVHPPPCPTDFPVD